MIHKLLKEIIVHVKILILILKNVKKNKIL